MAEQLAGALGKLGLQGRGNGRGDDGKAGEQGAEGDEKEVPAIKDRKACPEAKGDDEIPSVTTFNFMLDLNVPGHFPSQSAARRYLQNLMCLGR